MRPRPTLTDELFNAMQRHANHELATASQVEPTLLMIGTDGTRKIAKIGPMFINEDTKNALARAAPAMTKKFELAAVGMLTLAWATTTHAREPEGGRGDSIEIAHLMVQTPKKDHLRILRVDTIEGIRILGKPLAPETNEVTSRWRFFSHQIGSARLEA